MFFARSALLVLVAVFFRRGDAACTFLIPSTSNSSQCDGYDLSKIASIGGANYSANYSYVVTICENLPASSVPLVCSSKPPAPAYQYDNTSCTSIGNLSSPFAVSSIRLGFSSPAMIFVGILQYPVDPSDSTAGIRIAYNNGGKVFLCMCPCQMLAN